ncbi:MAG: hypothetical protein WCC64_16905, partial [Aliidongia sp.]
RGFLCGRDNIVSNIVARNAAKPTTQQASVLKFTPTLLRNLPMNTPESTINIPRKLAERCHIPSRRLD